MLFNCFDGYQMGRGTWLGNGMIGIIVIALLALLFILLLKKDSSKQKTNESALNLLDQRFVNGDLTEEEYMNKKKLINK